MVIFYFHIIAKTRYLIFLFFILFYFFCFFIFLKKIFDFTLLSLIILYDSSFSLLKFSFIFSYLTFSFKIVRNSSWFISMSINACDINVSMLFQFFFNGTKYSIIFYFFILPKKIIFLMVIFYFHIIAKKKVFYFFIFYFLFFLFYFLFFVLFIYLFIFKSLISHY